MKLLGRFFRKSKRFSTEIEIICFWNINRREIENVIKDRKKFAIRKRRRDTRRVFVEHCNHNHNRLLIKRSFICSIVLFLYYLTTLVQLHELNEWVTCWTQWQVIAPSDWYVVLSNSFRTAREVTLRLLTRNSSASCRYKRFCWTIYFFLIRLFLHVPAKLHRIELQKTSGVKDYNVWKQPAEVNIWGVKQIVVSLLETAPVPSFHHRGCGTRSGYLM